MHTRINKTTILAIISLLIILIIIHIFIPFISNGQNQTSNPSWSCYGGDRSHQRYSQSDTSDNKGGIEWKFRPEEADEKLSEFISPYYEKPTPVLDSNETIYFCAKYGTLYAVNPDGTLKWKYETGMKVTTTPAIGEDGSLYIGGFETYFQKGILYAIDNKGKKIWSFETDKKITSSPVIGEDNTIYIGCENEIIAVNPDGSKKWSKNIKAGEIQYPPSIGDNNTLFGTTSRGVIYSIDSDGGVRWINSTKRITSCSPAVVDNTIYVPSRDGYLFSLNYTGKVIWRAKIDGYYFSSPAVGPEGNIYVSSDSDRLYSITKDGEIRWSVDVEKGFGDFSPTIDGQGYIYLSANKGRIISVDPDGSIRWKTVVGRWEKSVDIKDTTLDDTTSPILSSDGTVYALSDKGTLYALSGDKTFFQSYSSSILIFVCTVIPAIVALSIAIILQRKTEPAEGRGKRPFGFIISLVVFGIMSFLISLPVFFGYDFYIYLVLYISILALTMNLVLIISLIRSIYSDERWLWRFLVIMSGTSFIIALISSFLVYLSSPFQMYLLYDTIPKGIFLWYLFKRNVKMYFGESSIELIRKTSNI